MKRHLKIEWAESTVLDALEPYVREIVDNLAEIENEPGLRDAFMSDRSAICDCLHDYEFTGEISPHPLHKDKTCRCVTHDTPKNRETVKRLSEALGVEVGIYDPIYEVAIRMRDRSS